MNNYKKINTLNEPRRELHDELGLTGAEVSINNLPAGTKVPFVHAHKNNEEIYLILDGSGYAIIDGEEVKLTKGDCLRISPSAKRQLAASNHEKITYACIQVRKNSLQGYTADDAIIF